jgi:hypothetical protein
MAMKKTTPKKTTKMPTGEKPKQLSPLAKRAMRETSVPSQAAFRAGTLRDRLAREKNTKANGTGARTSYSPEPMSIKKKLAVMVVEGRKAAMTPKQKEAAKAAAKKASYSPAPMSAAAKKAAANRGALRNSLSGLAFANLDKKAKSKKK